MLELNLGDKLDIRHTDIVNSYGDFSGVVVDYWKEGKQFPVVEVTHNPTGEKDTVRFDLSNAEYPEDTFWSLDKIYAIKF